MEGNPTFEDIRMQLKRNYNTTWGPVKFKKENHPLHIMVCCLCCLHIQYCVTVQ
jgi:hypothetical protein